MFPGTPIGQTDSLSQNIYRTHRHTQKSFISWLADSIWLSFSYLFGSKAMILLLNLFFACSDSFSYTIVLIIQTTYINYYMTQHYVQHYFIFFIKFIKYLHPYFSFPFFSHLFQSYYKIERFEGEKECEIRGRDI